MFNALMLPRGGLVSGQYAGDYSQRGTRASQLTGLTSGKQGLFSGWFAMTGGDGISHAMLNMLASGSARFDVQRDAANHVQIRGHDVGTVQNLRIETTATFLAGSGGKHVLASWDLAAGVSHLYINDASDQSVVTRNNGNIDFTNVNLVECPRFQSGASNQMDISEVFFHPTYLDLSVTANRRKFITATLKSAALGDYGENPLGFSPILYVPWDCQENRGTGGSFTLVGTLVQVPGPG